MPRQRPDKLPQKAQPQARITMPAFKHMARIVKAMKQQGRVVSYTSFMSDLILTQPIPNGSHPVAAAEIRQVNKEAQQ